MNNNNNNGTMTSNSNVSVFCRIRPRSKKADLEYGIDVLDVNPTTNQIHIRSDTILQGVPNSSNGNPNTLPSSLPSSLASLSSSFGPFDHVFSSTATQDDLFRRIGLPCITNVLDGYNSTVFVYGQTGSGKTYTIEGDIHYFNHHSGLIPRLVHSLFHTMQHTDDYEFTVRCTYIEVYMERVYDLLYNAVNVSVSSATTTTTMTKPSLRRPRSILLPNNPRNPPSLSIRQDNQRGIYVEGAVEKCVGSSTELMTLLRKGYKNRCNGMTGMNDQSSRSHTLVLLTIEAKDKTTGGIRTSKLSLVDLAGSEQVSRTGAEGNTLEEAKIINKSLFTLSKCITALANQADTNSSSSTNGGNDNASIVSSTSATATNDSSSTNNNPGSNIHIPYRDSKLTRLLQDSLGGNARTSLIICLSPCSSNLTETMSTLRFGNQAKKMKNIAIVNRRRTLEEMEKLVEKAQTTMEAQTQLINVLQQRIQTLENSGGSTTQVDSMDKAKSSPLRTKNEVLTQASTSVDRTNDKEEDDNDENDDDTWGDANAWSMVSPMKSPQPVIRRRLRTVDPLIAPLSPLPSSSSSHSAVLSLLSPSSMEGIISELSLAKETTARAVAASAMDAEELANLKEENRLLQQEIDNKEHTIHELMLQREEELEISKRSLQEKITKELWDTLHTYTCRTCCTQPYREVNDAQSLPLLHEALCFDIHKYKAMIHRFEEEVRSSLPSTTPTISTEYSVLVQAYNDINTKYRTLSRTNEGLQKDIRLRDERIDELQGKLLQSTESLRREKENYQQDKEVLIKTYEDQLVNLKTSVMMEDKNHTEDETNGTTDNDDDDDNYTVCDEFMEIEKIIGGILQHRKYNITTMMNSSTSSSSSSTGGMNSITVSDGLNQSTKEKNINLSNSIIVKPVEKENTYQSTSSRTTKETTNRVLVTKTIYTHRGPTVINTFIDKDGISKGELGRKQI